MLPQPSVIVPVAALPHMDPIPPRPALQPHFLVVESPAAQEQAIARHGPHQLCQVRCAKVGHITFTDPIDLTSFAANTAANHYIFNRSDVVSAIGAFVVGLLGNVYSRLFGGTAFQVMSVAVCFLIPSGIAATGGLSQNYHGQDGDSYSAGLSIGLRMVQVGIGITVGLFGSGLVVYSFGSRKKNALFAF